MNSISDSQKVARDLALARFAEVSAELQTRLRETLALAQTSATPESLLAAAVSFEDLDMLAYLRRSVARYEMALAGVDASVRAWREQRRALDAEAELGLQRSGAPLTELTEALIGDWSSIKSQFQSSPGQPGFFTKLDAQLEALVERLREAGLAVYR